MKDKKQNYVDLITKRITSNLSKVVEVQEYTLDDLTITIKDLKETEKESIIEEVINNQLLELKHRKYKEIRKVFKQVDDITDYFIKYYNDDSDIVSECDDIADDLLFKTIGRNERTINMPININYIKEYCLSSNISNSQIYDSLVWIALRLITINYCIKFNEVIEKDSSN